jgi:hypothetical protein
MELVNGTSLTGYVHQVLTKLLVIRTIIVILGCLPFEFFEVSEYSFCGGNILN